MLLMSLVSVSVSSQFLGLALESIGLNHLEKESYLKFYFQRIKTGLCRYIQLAIKDQTVSYVNSVCKK